MTLKIIRSAATWNLHCHSRYSVGDALPTVAELVSTAKSLNQIAIGLTDHGNMAGSVQLYKEATKAGIMPFPGTELYVVQDRQDGKAKRHHMCVVAYNTIGYRNLIKMNTMANQNFHYKPLVDFHDMAMMSENGLLDGIAATSGCYFGYIAQAAARGEFDEVRRLMRLMNQWFPKFYVELQNHNITHDTDITDDVIANALHNIALSEGIPTILTQDAHYAHPEDKIHHETMKRLVAWGDQPDDAVFPGDGFHLADDKWFQDRHPWIRFKRGVEGLNDLVESYDLHIDELDTYNYRIPFIVADPDKALSLRCQKAMDDRNLFQSKKHFMRMHEELEIIKDTRQAGYLLLVANVTDWCYENHVFFQARGSASGSLVCYLLGITQVDPLKYDLGFSRFISRDRTKPADIDLDVERNRRDDLIDMLNKNYAVAQIGTWLEMGMTDDSNGGKGSLVVKYYAQHNKRNEIKINEWDKIPHEDQSSLRELARMAPFSAHGTHAAGIIVTSHQSELDSLVPLMRVGDKKSPRYVSQYGMDDIEAMGLLKLDVLGSATMEILHRAMENLGRKIEDGLDWIPLSDRATYAMIARGQTDGVFQLEGGSARRGVRELKPTKLDDVIASMSLFRPATMNSGATESYIKRKNRLEEQPELPEILRKHTLKTYGTIIYQDQVINALRDIGIDPENLTAFLKAVKASNANIGNAGEVIKKYEAMVKYYAEEHGIVGETWDWFWESISGFAAYSFNLAHSTTYGLTAYRCAYLVEHHPTEFFAAVLSVWAGTPKEAQYVKAARQRGLRFRRPTVNDSQMSYSVIREGTIMKGLLSVDGIAERTARRIIEVRPAGGFESIRDFCVAVGPSFSGVRNYINTGETDSGTLGKMVAAGMFESMEET